ncbi:MAG: FAD-dependent oxidoreductase [Planctomycetes bacterium]|nr:FAD-dependent oxidoreductase [Planctomycetota bacterium]
MQQDAFEVENIDCDFCVVGGGMSGICAAIAAARKGIKTVLVQDRAVLGGNASSEVRMWICGAHGADNKETGILEEILLENLYRNPGLKYTVWDTVLYEKVHYQENLTLLLNTSCNDLRMHGNSIQSIRCWQLTTQKWIHISAKQFADCSGDSVLRISGAEFRWGREDRKEFNESHAPEVADRKTMGNSLLLQLRKLDSPEDHVPFIPPQWAHSYTEDDLPNRNLQAPGDNFWWLEFGGIKNTIDDAENIRDELYRIAYGVWDLIKNHPDGRGHQWELEWIGSLPGKRENVRYEGAHILTQNDVEAEGHFDDIVAFGGWSMDDHHPEAIEYKGEPTIFHPAPSPYGIPLRCLYSKNITNLWMAGRNISATHMALSSTRVMATCAILGQAVGTAAAIAIRNNIMPHGVYSDHIDELQATLMDDDAYLPWKKRIPSRLMSQAEIIASTGDAQEIISGIDRQLADHGNAWQAACGDHIEIRLSEAGHVSQARFTFDSNLRSTKRMPCTIGAASKACRVPKQLIKAFRLEAQQEDGSWKVVCETELNYQRLLRIDLQLQCRAVRFTPLATWGDVVARVFAFELS